MRRALIVLVTLFIAIMAGVVYFAYDPSQSHFFPRCVFLSLTGWQCPGCGSQRAIHSLLHGDLASAWHYNAALLVALPVLGVYLVGELKRTTWPNYYRAISRPIVIYIILGALIAWWIGRNLVNS